MTENRPFHMCDYCSPTYERNEKTTRLFRGINGACICHPCLGRMAEQFVDAVFMPGITDVVEHDLPRPFK